MKSIINGKRYDTETAEEIANWDNGIYSRRDFNWCDETLYRTTTGALFLHGEGGPLTRYAESSDGGNSFGSGSSILPMTEQEAVAWLEDRQLPNVIEKHFASHVQDA